LEGHEFIRAIRHELFIVALATEEIRYGLENEFHIQVLAFLDLMAHDFYCKLDYWF